ncbi:MAG: hypothetical protein GX030_01150 [Firmicutes bacterium]|nr:hypothetical protein [Bacillota bacterium]
MPRTYRSFAVISFLILGAALTVAAVICIELGIGAAASLGYVDMERAMTQHPLYSELVELQKQIQEEEQRWDRYVGQVLATSDPQAYQEWVATLYGSGVSTLQEENHRQIAQRQEKIEAQLAQELERLQQEALTSWEQTQENHRQLFAQKQEELATAIEAELNAEAELVRKSYQREILNLQVELLLQNSLTSQERLEKTAQLEELQDEMQDRLQELSGAYTALLEDRIAELAQQMERDLKSLEDEANNRLEAQIKEAEALAQQELDRYLRAKEESMVAALTTREETLARMQGPLLDTLIQQGLVSEQSRQMQSFIEGELQTKAQRLLETIHGDIQAAATQVAQRQRLQVVLTDSEFSEDLIDVTDSVIDAMR